MRSSFFFAACLALPLAAAAQTTPPRQVTEVTEDLDPATGKVVRRTTRTYDAPAAQSAAETTAVVAPATDAQVSEFLHKKAVVGILSTTALLAAYDQFMERVRADRTGWKPADWETAAAVLSSLNGRYEQLRPDFSLDDKVTIRSQQAEFQALRTAKQISRTLSDKL